MSYYVVEQLALADRVICRTPVILNDLSVGVSEALLIDSM